MKQKEQLERVRRDRGEGDPVPLGVGEGRKRREGERPRGVEISLDHGDSEDSDDMAADQGW